MKNIIKRGTSLLLVLAMLLSFAAVVGATDATTTTPEKILTLTVENKLLRAGQTEYLAVYEQVAGDYKINALTISATSTNSKVAVKGIYPWIPKSYSGGAWITITTPEKLFLAVEVLVETPSQHLPLRIRCLCGRVPAVFKHLPNRCAL